MVSMVQRLRRCPVVAEIRVRFPLVTPISPYRSGLPTDKIAGYEPANEGSIPSPNTTFEPKKESYLYGIKNLSFTHLLVIRARRRAHFNQDIAQLAEHVLGVHEATGSKPVFLTISKE